MDGIIGFSGLIGFWIGYKVFKTKKKKYKTIEKENQNILTQTINKFF
jgi:hypothetical protein